MVLAKAGTQIPRVSRAAKFFQLVSYGCVPLTLTCVVTSTLLLDGHCGRRQGAQFLSFRTRVAGSSQTPWYSVQCLRRCLQCAQRWHSVRPALASSPWFAKARATLRRLLHRASSDAPRGQTHRGTRWQHCDVSCRHLAPTGGEYVCIPSSWYITPHSRYLFHTHRCILTCYRVFGMIRCIASVCS